MDNQFNFCRVCGLFHEDAPWGESGTYPTFNICECCGVEFGYEDVSVNSVKAYRNKWLSLGSIWFSIKFKPSNWNIDEQLKNIPTCFK